MKLLKRDETEGVESCWERMKCESSGFTSSLLEQRFPPVLVVGHLVTAHRKENKYFICNLSKDLSCHGEKHHIYLTLHHQQQLQTQCLRNHKHYHNTIRLNILWLSGLFSIGLYMLFVSILQRTAHERIIWNIHPANVQKKTSAMTFAVFALLCPCVSLSQYRTSFLFHIRQQVK